MARYGADLRSLRSTCNPLYGSPRLQASILRPRGRPSLFNFAQTPWHPWAAAYHLGRAATGSLPMSDAQRYRMNAAECTRSDPGFTPCGPIDEPLGALLIFATLARKLIRAGRQSLVTPYRLFQPCRQRALYAPRLPLPLQRWSPGQSKLTSPSQRRVQS